MMPFANLDAIAAAFPMANVDTDKILPARFLKTITREGLGKFLFWAYRQDPSFILNRHPWDNAGIFIGGDNFGCGSSREHAPWSLLDFGIRCIIAPSIADIFYNNCFKNGILPIRLAAPTVARLSALATDASTARLTIQLESQLVVTTGGERISFEIEPSRKHGLLHGTDEIADSLSFSLDIAKFEAARQKTYSWLPIVPLNPGS